MRRTLRKAALVCGMLAGMAGAAAGPTSFSYQGKLMSAGAPYSGSADLRVSVYDAATGGTLIAGPQTVSGVAVAGGVYSTAFDFGAIFGGGARWLQVEVRTPSGVGSFVAVTPRQLVGASPIATSVVGMSASAGVDISQTQVAGIVGASTPVNMVQTFRPTSTGRLLGVTLYYSVPAPVPITITVADSAGTLIAGASATATPAGTGAQVMDFKFSTPPVLAAGTTYRLNLPAGDGVSFPALAVTTPSAYADGNLNNDPAFDAFFITMMDGAGRKFEMPVNFSKSVGIGTDAPAAPLHIVSPEGIVIGKNTSSGGSTALAIGLTKESNGAATIQAIRSAGSAYGALVLNPAPSPVGVGNQYPEFQLDVWGEANANALRVNSFGDATVLSITNSSGGKNYSLLSSSAGNFSVRDVGAAQDRLTLHSNGRLGIGFAAAPDAQVEVRGAVNATAVSAKSGSGSGAIGLYASGTGPGVRAGVFDGNVTINGNLQVNGSVGKTTGSFRIPHPLDPENKWLYHSFVESPDMMNVYNGMAVLDENGEAAIELPEYFEALNSDYRYQLTPVGASMPGLYVSREVERNRFGVAGGKAGAKVSWQVTGIRQDEGAKKHPIVPQVERTAIDP